MKLLIASEDHLGLNSKIYKEVLESPYFTLVDYSSGKINKVINLENELDENKIDEFIKLAAEKNISTVVCNDLSSELEDRLKENDINVVSNKKGRIADIIKNL
ncbi:MAG: NifB/NifX family molybdenum-iron cluster-binding protein [Halanaerobium sp.]